MSEGYISVRSMPRASCLNASTSALSGTPGRAQVLSCPGLPIPNLRLPVVYCAPSPCTLARTAGSHWACGREGGPGDEGGAGGGAREKGTRSGERKRTVAVPLGHARLGRISGFAEPCRDTAGSNTGRHDCSRTAPETWLDCSGVSLQRGLEASLPGSTALLPP